MFFKHLVFVISVLSFVHSAPSCGENEVYTNCMAPCKLQHCKHLKQMPDCDPNIKCQPGCECIQNFLRNSDNVCISSEVCEEYDSQFDPETDIDVILNESDDDEAINEDQIFDTTVSPKDGLAKETEPGSKMKSNTEEIENSNHDTKDDDQDIIGIENYQMFDDEIKNGDWVIEQTEHNDTNQEPNIDQNKLNNEESEMDTERSTEKQNVQAPDNKVEPTTEKKLKTEEIESNRTELNQNNIDDKIGNTKFDQKFDVTLETSTMPEYTELPNKRPIAEVYPEDKKDTIQRLEPPRPGHDEQPNKTRPEQNTGESQESSNIPENNEQPNKTPVIEVNPEDKEDTNKWRAPTEPWHDEQPNKTRPEQNTEESQESSNMPEYNERPNKRPVTKVYPKDRENKNEWSEPPNPWYDEQPNKTRPEQNTEESQESSNMPENNEQPNKRPVIEVNPEDKEDTNKWRAPTEPWHDEQPNKTRPEKNTEESQESSNTPEYNERPNKRPVTEVYPKDRENTKQWREPPRPWHDEEPYTTSRPEQSTKPWYPYPPRRRHGSNRQKRPRSRNNQITIIYPIVHDNSNQRHTYPDTRPKYQPGYESEHKYNYGRNREHLHDRERGHENERNRERGHDRERGHENERNHERGHDRERGHENERNHERGHDRERGHVNERNHERGHDRERGHENEHNREHGHDRNREQGRRREDKQGREGKDRPNHTRPRTWCRRYPGDKRRPCPWYNRPKYDSHPDYKNKEHNNNHDRSYRRPKRVCRNQRYGKPICYVPKSYKRDSRRN